LALAEHAGLPRVIDHDTITEGSLMPWPSKQSSPASDAEVIVYDDGGSGLFAACEERFGSSDCTVECDARHTVWVKRADGSRSVGLAPWQLSRNTLEEVLENVSKRLSLGVHSH
jgi:hypothetical protein